MTNPTYPLLYKAVDESIHSTFGGIDEKISGRTAEVLLQYTDDTTNKMDTLLTATFLMSHSRRASDDPKQVALDYNQQVADLLCEMKSTFEGKDTKNVSKDGAKILGATLVAALELILQDNQLKEIANSATALPSLVKEKVAKAVKNYEQDLLEKTQNFENLKNAMDAPRLATFIDQKLKETDDLIKGLKTLCSIPSTAVQKTQYKM